MNPEAGHWYFPDGTACHTVPRAKGPGDRPTTLADARKLGLYPSVTTVLKVLDKPALNEWKIRQNVMAVATSPDIIGETLDQKITRVLDTEGQQDEEAKVARELGTAIHKTLERALCGVRHIDSSLWPWVEPAYREVLSRGVVRGTERTVVGPGYAGTFDLEMETPDAYWLWDWKTCKKLPDPKRGAWMEHRLQLAAYASAWESPRPGAQLWTGNVYISTVEQGAFVICPHPHWLVTFEDGFDPAFRLWQYLNNYFPGLPALPLPATPAGLPHNDPAANEAKLLSCGTADSEQAPGVFDAA